MADLARIDTIIFFVDDDADLDAEIAAESADTQVYQHQFEHTDEFDTNDPFLRNVREILPHQTRGMLTRRGNVAHQRDTKKHNFFSY